MHTYAATWAGSPRFWTCSRTETAVTGQTRSFVPNQLDWQHGINWGGTASRTSGCTAEWDTAAGNLLCKVGAHPSQCKTAMGGSDVLEEETVCMQRSALRCNNGARQVAWSRDGQVMLAHALPAHSSPAKV